jgi:hypothetical protein
VGHRRNKRGNQKVPGIYENENTMYKILWKTAKAILKEQFIAMSAYINRTERAQINNLMLHLKLLEQQEQAKPKTSRRREIILKNE